MIRVLHVDDEASFLEIASHFMQKIGGLEIHGATSVRSAMDMMSQVPFDAIVSDYQMPETDGLEFLKTIRAGGSEIPFILFTGRGREDVVIEALNLGADYYLQKGGDLRSQFHELGSILSKAVEGRGASAQLLESQERFRRLADSISDVLIALDNDLRVTFWNKAASDLLGIKPGDAIGERPFDLIPQVKETPVESALRAAASARRVKTVALDLALGGDERTFDVSVYPGKEGVLVFARDNTTVRAAAKMLEESEERYKSLVETSPDAVIVLAIDRILYVNPAAVRVYGGVDESDLVGKSVFDIMPPEHAAEAADGIRRIYEEAIAPPLQVTKVFTKSGRTLDMEARSAPIKFSGKKAVQTVLRDVTERKKAEEGLKDANKRLSLLGSMTQHDSMNQLTILRGWLDAAIEKEGDDQVRDLLLKVETAADALKKELELTYQYGTLGMKPSNWVSLEEAISNVTGDFRARGVSFRVDVNDIEVFADPMIDNVFRNLINNSIEHGDHADRISFTCKEGKEGLVIVYEDNGIGIHVDEKEKIFERGHGKLHGYGLHLSREVLSLTGMTIKETGTPAEGARFEMTVAPENYRRKNR